MASDGSSGEASEGSDDEEPEPEKKDQMMSLEGSEKLPPMFKTFKKAVGAKKQARV